MGHAQMTNRGKPLLSLPKEVCDRSLTSQFLRATRACDKNIFTGFIGSISVVTKRLFGNKNAIIHYNKQLHTKIPLGLISKIERNIATNFGTIVPGIDYDSLCGSDEFKRAVIIRLSRPIAFNGARISEIKIKGIAFDSGTLDEHYDLVQRYRELGYRIPCNIEQMVLVVDAMGRARTVPKGQEPLGAMYYKYAENSFVVAAHRFNEGCVVNLPLACGKYTEDRSREDIALGFTVVGLLSQKCTRASDRLAEINNHYGPLLHKSHGRRHRQAFKRAIEQTIKRYAKALRDFHDSGYIHYSFHLGQVDFCGNRSIVHDFDQSKKKSTLTPPQAFTYQVFDLRQALRCLPLYKNKYHAGIDFGKAFWDGYFYDLLSDSLTNEARNLIDEKDVFNWDQFFREAKEKPLIKVRHPLIELMRKVFTRSG